MCYIPPDEGESQIKMVMGKTFCWYAKCKRWTTTHNTATHIGNPQTSQNATSSANVASFSDLQISDPSAWLFDVSSAFGFEAFAPLLWFCLAYGLSCAWNSSDIWFPLFTEWVLRFLASV